MFYIPFTYSINKLLKPTDTYSEKIWMQTLTTEVKCIGIKNITHWREKN